jgi:hypothetical protein
MLMFGLYGFLLHVGISEMEFIGINYCRAFTHSRNTTRGIFLISAKLASLLP